jgi:hypothetical protein
MKSLIMALCFFVQSAYATDIAASKARVVADTKAVLNRVVAEFSRTGGGKVYQVAANKQRISDIYNDKKVADTNYESQKRTCFTLSGDAQVKCLDDALKLLRQTLTDLDAESARLGEEIKNLEGEILYAARMAPNGFKDQIAKLVVENGLAFEGATTLYVSYHRESHGTTNTLSVGGKGWGLGGSMYHEFYDFRPLTVDTASVTPAGNNKFSLSVTGKSSLGSQVAVSGTFEPADPTNCSYPSALYRILNPDGKISGIPANPISTQERQYFEILWGAGTMVNRPENILTGQGRCAHFTANYVNVFRN